MRSVAGPRVLAGLVGLLLPVAAEAQAQNASPTHAQGEASIGLTIVQAACDGPTELDGQAVLQHLRAEVAPARVQVLTVPAPAAATGALWLRLCAGQAPELGLLVGGQPEERQTIDLSDSSQDTQSRTLAIAIAEFHRAHQPLPIAPPAQAEAGPAPTATPEPHAEPRVDARPGWYVSTALRSFVADSTWTLGPEAGVAWGPLRFGVSALGHRSQVQLGFVWLMSATAVLAYEPFVFGSAPAIAPRIRGELGATFGFGNADADYRAESAVAPQAALALELPLRVPVAAAFSLELAAHVGLASGLRARDDDHILASTSDLFAGLSLGLAPMR